VEDAMRKLKDYGTTTLQIYIKGPGNSRDSALRAFQASGVRVTLIRDVTPIAHNGCRPPKRRRV
jgi:small subunit ribosomal protein S11